MEAFLASPGVVEALFTLIGTLIGFTLSELSTSRREKRIEKKQAEASKTIISLEIDLNLELLGELWSKTTHQIQNEIEEKHDKKVVLALNFINTPIPEWRQEVINSQLSFITSALHHQEVVKVFRFYDRLRRLDAIRNELVIASEVQRNEFHAATKKDDSHSYGRYVSMAYFPPTPFNVKAKDVWNECESLVAQLLAKGNPLKNANVSSK